MAAENVLVICGECKHSVTFEYMSFIFMCIMVLYGYCNEFSVVNSIHSTGSYLDLKIFLSLNLSSSWHEGCVNPWF